MSSRNWGVLGVLALSLCAAVLCQETISVKEGETAEFQCNYPNGLQNFRVEWKFNSGQDTILVYYDGALTMPYESRAMFYPQGLQLKSVTRKDNGEYVCEVTGKDSSGKPTYYEKKILLVVLVPPSVPIAQVPTSVTTGSKAELVCNERDSSPPATFTWYMNGVPMPVDPKSSPAFQNTSYTLDPKTGVLKFNNVMKSDAGQFYCEATNSQGKQASAPVPMEVNDVNVGGIVAAVIVVLLLLGLIAFAVWFAYSRGYIGKKTNKKVIYSQPSETRSDKNFQQTSSFVV